MDDLDKQLADLQADLDAQLQQVQADIDETLGVLPSKFDSVEKAETKHTYYPEIQLDLGFQIALSEVSVEEAEKLQKVDVDEVDESGRVPINIFGKMCDEILMCGGHSIFYHMLTCRSDLKHRFMIKDENGTIVFNKELSSIPEFYYDLEEGVFDENYDTDGICLADYGCTDNEDFYEWQNEKRSELNDLDYSSVQEEASIENEIAKSRFNLLGIYEEENKTIKFSCFESETFDPTKLVRVTRSLPYHDFGGGEIGFSLEDLNDVGFLVYDGCILDAEENDYSKRSWHEFELFEDDNSIQYRVYGGRI